MLDLRLLQPRQRALLHGQIRLDVHVSCRRTLIPSQSAISQGPAESEGASGRCIQSPSPLRTGRGALVGVMTVVVVCTMHGPNCSHALGRVLMLQIRLLHGAMVVLGRAGGLRPWEISLLHKVRPSNGWKVKPWTTQSGPPTGDDAQLAPPLGYHFFFVAP